MNDNNNPELKILNGAMKYAQRVRDQNRNYELNNNLEIDNGKVKIPNDSDEKNKKEKKPKKDKENSPYNNSFSKINSKHISPFHEFEDDKKNKNKNNEKEKDILNEKALEIVESLGYKKSFIKESIINKNFNYATTSYRLTVKYFFP